MTKVQVIKNALYAVSYQQTNARNQFRIARDFMDEQQSEFWQKEIKKHEATYQGLLKMLTELNTQGGDS